MSVIRWPK